MQNVNNENYFPPCKECGGKCCEYVAIEIDKPKTKKDFDYIRWFLLHKNVNVFIDHENKWFTEFRTECLAQKDDKTCEIYSERPKICRDHGTEQGNCEFFDTPYKRYFSDVKDFEKYLSKNGIDWKFKKLK